MCVIRSIVLLLGASLLAQNHARAEEASEVLESVSVRDKATLRRPELLDRLRERIHVSYWATFNGPGVGRAVDQGVDGEGEVDGTGTFQMLWTGLRLNRSHAIGVLNRFSQDFSYLSSAGERVPSGQSLLDPRLYWRQSGLVDNRAVNFTHEVRIESPVTERASRAGRRTAFQSVSTFAFKPASPRWSPGILGAASLFLNHKDPTFLNLAGGPYVTYSMSPKWSLYAWTMFDADQLFSAPLGTLDGMGPGSDTDLLRVGPMYAPLPTLQIYPCVEVTLFNPQMRTTSFALELSAQL